MSDYVGLCRILSDFVGFCRIMSDYVGLCRIMSDYVGLCQTSTHIPEYYIHCIVMIMDSYEFNVEREVLITN